MKQIQVLHPVEGMASAGHAEACFQERLIVRLTVVSDEDIEVRQVLGQPVQQRRLFSVIPHEELAQAESLTVYRSNANQEGISARASSQPRGFGVEERP